jgi:NO-binding membrane sensor protein with MHYT domain
MLSSTYNQVFVFLSLIVAIIASYTALVMAGRVSSTTGRAAKTWLLGGAFAMGMGV